jgi:type IX secretion system PorP/SprF family membrane protein
MQKFIGSSLIYNITLIAVIFGSQLNAQSDVIVNNRWLNSFPHNPASIENSEYLNINLMTRNQWVGFGGAPSSQILTVTGFLEDYSSGFGLSIINDKIGYTKLQNFDLSYSYQMVFENDLLWALGLTGGLFNRSIDVSQIDIKDESDILLSNQPKSSIAPDISFGTELIHPRFSLGASISNLSAIWNQDYILGKTMQNYAYFKLNTKLLERLTLTSGISFLNRKNINIIEANTMLYWGDPSVSYQHQKPLWLGVSYKFEIQDVTAFFGINITRNLSVGYNYEFNLQDIGRNSNGTHEIVMQLKIKMYEKLRDCPAYAFERYWTRR